MTRVGLADTRGMRINRDNSNAWYDWDPETVRNTHGGIHHGQSAIQNFRAIGEDLGHALVPDRAIVLAAEGAAIVWPLAILGFIGGLFADIAEIFAFFFMFFKNGFDAAGHGVAAAVNTAQGESDGEPDARDIRPFEWTDKPSAARQSRPDWRGKALEPPQPNGVTTPHG